MIRNLGSVELAYQAWQRQAIPHIVRIAWDGGAGLDRESPDWRYGGMRKGKQHWYNAGQRDIICFPPDAPVQEYKRIPGPMRTSDLEPVIAVVDNIANHTDRDQPPATVEYERGITITRREVDQGKLGLSITSYIEGQAGGGETTGGSYVKAGLSSTLSAEYLHALEKGRDESGVVTLTKAVIPKANSISVIEQAVQKGIATVKVRERLILDPAWWVVDYKKLYRGGGRSGWLFDNKDWSHWNGKSRIVWKCESIAELHAQLEGRHAEYPRARDARPLNNHWVRKAYEWLADEDNRTIESETTIKFDTAQQGDASIRYAELD